MFKNTASRPLKRRTVVKARLAIGALQVAPPPRRQQRSTIARCDPRAHPPGVRRLWKARHTIFE